MARLRRPEQASTNPAKHFLEWKSDEECFSFYDKEKEENVLVKKPLKLLFLEHYHGVKGWNDADHSGIWSNEVFLISKENLTVKTKTRTIAEGLYKDIKDKVKNAGANYLRVIYAMTEKGEIIRIGLKGASVGGVKKEKAVDGKDHQGYSDFYKDHSHLLDNQWFIFNGATKGKSGKVNYSIPVFEMGEVLTDEENVRADNAVSILQDFIDSKSETPKEAEPKDIEPAELDELDF